MSASVMGVLIVYSLSKVFNRYLVFALTLLLALYVSYAKFLPDTMQLPYEWYADNLREDVGLSFPAQMVWISIGQILAGWLINIEKYGRILTPISFSLFGVAYILSLFYPLFLLRIMMVIALFIFCFLVQLPDNKIYKRLRNYSILMFFFHFSIAGKMGLFCRFVGDTLLTNWLYYVLVLIASIVFAEVVLRLEKNKYLRFLKYTH